MIPVRRISGTSIEEFLKDDPFFGLSHQTNLVSSSHEQVICTLDSPDKTQEPAIRKKLRLPGHEAEIFDFDPLKGGPASVRSSISSVDDVFDFDLPSPEDYFMSPPPSVGSAGTSVDDVFDFDNALLSDLSLDLGIDLCSSGFQELSTPMPPSPQPTQQPAICPRQKVTAPQEERTGQLINCITCRKSYKRREDVRACQRDHRVTSKSREVIRGRTCSVCRKVCSSPVALRTHLLTHTGEKPFKCYEEGCTKEYREKSALKKHYKRFHSDKLGKMMDQLARSKISIL